MRWMNNNNIYNFIFFYNNNVAYMILYEARYPFGDFRVELN